MRKFLLMIKGHHVNCVNYLVVRESSDDIQLVSFSQDMKGHAKTPNDFDCQHFWTIPVEWIIWFIYPCCVINDFVLWLTWTSRLSDIISGGFLTDDLTKQNYLLQQRGQVLKVKVNFWTTVFFLCQWSLVSTLCCLSNFAVVGLLTGWVIAVFGSFSVEIEPRTLTCSLRTVIVGLHDEPSSWTRTRYFIVQSHNESSCVDLLARCRTCRCLIGLWFPKIREKKVLSIAGIRTQDSSTTVSVVTDSAISHFLN